MPTILTCPYRQPLRRPWGQHAYGCVASLNFYDVGEEMALCRSCPVPRQDIAHDCDQLDVYTRLCYDEHGQAYIEAELWCGYEDSSLSRAGLCNQCPLRQPQSDIPLILLPHQGANSEALAR